MKLNKVVLLASVLLVTTMTYAQEIKEITPAVTDLNDVNPGKSTTAQSYFFKTDPGWSNTPSGYVNYGIVTGFDANSFHQIAFGNADENMYLRTYAWGYGAWRKVWHSGNFDPESFIQKGAGLITMNGGNSLYSDANNLAFFTNGGYVFGNSNNTLTRATIGSNGSLSLYNPTDVGISLNPAGNSFIREGNVGIGTVSPTQKLSVNGTVLAKKVKVSQVATDWPDYVFDSSYQLPSLDSVSNFIQANKHLPDMPSAAVVEKDGHDLGEVQKLLLKKMEEMTLYMIELKKENQLMKKESELMKQQNELMKKEITTLQQKK